MAKRKYWIEGELPKVARAVLRRPRLRRGAYIWTATGEKQLRKIAARKS
jgi:hypothetical protein